MVNVFLLEAQVLKFLKSSNLVGLDIGTHSIKVVHLKGSSDNISLANLALVEVPIEVQEEVDSEAKNDFLAEAVKKLVKEHNIPAKDVVTAISGEEAIVRYVKLPSMNREELKNVISYEAEQYIPLSMDQVVLDFEILGEFEEEGQKKIEVLLVAAKTELVDRHVELVQRAGLHPVVIDVDAFALGNACEQSYGKLPGETVSLIHMGAKLTTINMLEDGISHLTRDVAVAGNNFSRELQREFSLDFSEAEALKRSQGQALVEAEDILQINVAGDKEDKSQRIGEAVTPVLNKLLAEIRRSFDYYETTIRRKPISRILLSGGTSRLKNLDKYLSEKLNLPVELNDPFKNIRIEDRKFDRDFITANAQIFNVSLGLALRQAAAA